MDPERKPNSHAVLKNLPEDRQEQIAEWCAQPSARDADGKVIKGTGGIEFARAQLKKDGLAVGSETVREFFAWWRRRQRSRMLLDAGKHYEELMAKFRPGDVKLAREWGEYMMLERANQTEDKDIFTVATMAQDSRRRLDLEEASGKFKAQAKTEQLAQGRQRLDLDRAKWEFDAAEAVLKNLSELKTVARDKSLSSEAKVEQIRLKLWGTKAARSDAGRAPDAGRTDGPTEGAP